MLLLHELVGSVIGKRYLVVVNVIVCQSIPCEGNGTYWLALLVLSKSSLSLQACRSFRWTHVRHTKKLRNRVAHVLSSVIGSNDKL